MRRRLSKRLDDEQVDVDVRRAGCHEGDAVGDVVGGQRLIDAGVDGISLRLVATHPHQGELLGAHHAGRDLGDPDRAAVQFEAQRLDQGGRRVLRRRVTAAAFVGQVPGDRSGDDDVPAVAALQRRQQRLGDPQDAEHVRVVHRLPVGRVGGLDRVDADARRPRC